MNKWKLGSFALTVMLLALSVLCSLLLAPSGVRGLDYPGACPYADGAPGDIERERT